MSAGSRGGPKLFAALFLGGLAGLVWACIETGKAPWSIFKRKSIVRPPEPRPPAARRDPEPEKPSPPPIVSGPKVEPKKPDPPAVEPKRADPSTLKLSEAEWSVALSGLERHLRRGKLEEFHASLRTIPRGRVPDSGVADLRRLEEKYAVYVRLLSETDAGRIMPPPPLHNFQHVNGNEILAKLTTTDDRSYWIETLIGIAMRLDRNRVKGEPEKLNPDRAMATAEFFLESKCGNKGIMRQKKDELIVGFFDDPKRNPPPSAMSYFDIAEFAAENGLAPLIPLLFDKAYEKDRNIVSNVHETKAARLVDLIRFYDNIQSKEDAQESFMRMNTRYYDTAAFGRNREWLKEKYGALVRETAPPPPTFVPVPTPEPEPEPTAKNDSNPVGADPVSNGNKTYDGMDRVRPGAPPKPVADDKWQRPVSGPITVDAAREHVASGDRLYAEGKKHLVNSDPNENPNGWAGENKSALKLMGQAYEEYDTAQVIYEKLNLRIPADLLEKVRETNMIRSMCRKRSVSSR
jgi:hypothetical protein